MRLATIAFITVISSFAGALPALAQVSIQTDGSDPHGSAMLDVKGTTKGMLVPRVALSSTASSAPINPAPAASLEVSLLVYNTATAGDVTPGYYYWDGSAWIRLMSGNTPPLLTEVDPTFTGAANTTGAISRIGAITVSNRLTLNSTGFDEHLLIQRTGAPDARLSTSTGAWIQMWPGASGDYTTKGLRINNSGTIQLMGYGNGIVRATASNGTLTSGGAISLTSEVTGLLPVANGGTGIGTLTGVVIGSGTAAMGAVAGTASQFLRRNAANTAYEFVTMTPALVGMTNLTFNSAGTGAASGTAYNGSTAYTISYNTIGATGGSGTLNYVSKFTGANTLGNSQIFDNGTNVGIGNTTLGEKLHVSGNLRLGSTGAINAEGESLQFMQGVRADDNAYEWAGFYSGAARQGIILYDGAWTGANNITDEFSITAENGNRLTLNTQSGRHIALMPKGTGNVGINTLTPVARLEIEGPAANWNETTPGLAVGSIHLDPGSTAANLGSAITWGAHDASAGDNAQAGIYVRSDGSYGTKMYLSTTDSYAAGAKTRMFINSNGNVGIGTTGPQSLLHVRGGKAFINQLAINAQTANYAAADLVIGDNTTTRNGYGGTNGSHIFLQSVDKSTITALDESNNLGQIAYQNLRWTIGEDIGWGAQSIRLPVLGAGYVKSDASGVLSSGAIAAGDLPAHTHPWNQVTAKPSAWLDAANLIEDNANFNNSRPSGFYQSSGAANAPGGNWYNMINVRHSNTGNDHGFQIAASYYDEKIWTRTYQGGTGANNGTYTPWAELISSRSTSNANWVLNGDFAFSPDDITGASVLSGDDVIATYTMPFSLTMGGVSYNAITISTNGWISFGNPGFAALGNDCLPSSTFSAPTIFPYWDDLVTNNSNVRYFASGQSPNRAVVVDFECRTFSGSFNVRFQVTIHETSGLINVQYRDQMHPSANGQGATIGFQLAGGSSAKAYPIICNGKILDDNRSNSMGWSVSPVR